MNALLPVSSRLGRYLIFSLFWMGLSLLPQSAAGQCAEKASAHTGQSNIDPFEANESCFVTDVDPSLDLPERVYKGQEELPYDVYTTRYVGTVDGDGFLADPGAHLSQGTLVQDVTLTFVAKITMPDDEGQLGDGYLNVDVILNQGTANETELGPLEGGYFLDFIGSPGLWQQFGFEVPVEAVKFPDDPGCPFESVCDAIEPRANTITLRFSGDHVCDASAPSCPEAEVDWISLGTKGDEGLAWRPSLLLHGLGSTSATMQAGTAWADGLEARDLGYHAVSLTPRGTIVHNGSEVTQAVTDMKERFGVDRVHLVGHSKGGLDGRESVRYHNGVENLITLGSPHGGTPLAIVNVMALTDLLSLGLSAFVQSGFGGNSNMSVQHMLAYNLRYRPNSHTRYITVAGDNTGTTASNLLLLLGRNDGIVGVSSAQGLGYAVPKTYTSSDVTTTHSGLRYNTQVVDDMFDAYLRVRTAHDEIPLQVAPSPAPVAEVARMQAAAGPGASSALRAVSDEPQTVAATGGVAEDGQTYLHTTALDAGDAALFLLQWEEEDLGFDLVSPTGTRIDPATTDPAATYLAYQEEEPPIYVGYRIDDPEPEMWTLEVTGTDVTAPEGVPYAVATMLEGSDVALVTSVDQDAYLNGSPVTITAVLTEGGVPVTNAVVEAVVVHPDLATMVPLTLYDDGSNGDPVAGDGEYTGVFNDTAEAGQYVISVTAERTTAPSFTRRGVATADVAVSGSASAGSVSDHGVDADGDGLYDTLVIDLDVTVDAAGAYWVMASLTDGHGTEIQPLRVEADLETDTGLPVHQHSSVHTTAAYVHTDFQQPAIRLTGVTRDYGRDVYGDASYEYLIVEVEADLLWAGDYNWTAHLYDLDDTFIAAAGNEGSLEAGTATLDFTKGSENAPPGRAGMNPSVREAG